MFGFVGRTTSLMSLRGQMFGLVGRTTGLMSLRGQMFGLVGNSTSRMFLQKELTRVVVQPVTVSRRKNAVPALSLYEGELERVIVF